ncbi:hypothetical protein ABZ464_27735 [Streptomyces sp. NPDC005820]|uniref:hypothetical protein n=1 Tax=Streptomyces sp. NPDC005820 TaxID=3157069 RepID=UPI00340508FA
MSLPWLQTPRESPVRGRHLLRRQGLTTLAGQQTASDLAFLARAMKAPVLLAAADRLAERARKKSWTHTEWLGKRDNMSTATNRDSRQLFPGRLAGQPMHPTLASHHRKPALRDPRARPGKWSPSG